MASLYTSPYVFCCNITVVPKQCKIFILKRQIFMDVSFKNFLFCDNTYCPVKSPFEGMKEAVRKYHSCAEKCTGFN